MARKRHRTQVGPPIAELRQIRALGSSVRQDIADVVAAIGPCTVAELSAALGRPADGLYYHLRVLKRAKLVEVRERGRDGVSTQVLDVPARLRYVSYDPTSPSNRKAVLRLASAMMRSALRQFDRSFRPDIAVVSGPSRNLWASRSQTLLTPSERRTLIRLLTEVLEFLHSRPRSHRNSARLHEFTFVLSPTAPWGRTGS